MNTLILIKDFDGKEPLQNALYVASILKEFGDVHIISYGKQNDYIDNGINIHFVDFNLQADNIFNWTMLLNNEFKRRAVELNDIDNFDLIHAHDWTSGSSGMSLSKLFNVPLISTFHSTEHQRGFGAYISQIISDVEWWLAYESRTIFVTNQGTRASLMNDLKVPGDKIFDSNRDNIIKIVNEMGVKQ